MRKRTLILLAAALFATGCSQKEAGTPVSAATSAATAAITESKTDTPPETAASGQKTVTVVTAGSGTPYSLLEDGGKWTGIDAEMWEEIGNRTGWTIQVKQAAFDSVFGELDTGRAQVAANCYAIKTERTDKYYASAAYYGDAQCLAVKGDNQTVKTFDDLKGKKVGVTSGQASETILDDMSKTYGFELVIYESLNTGYADLDLGRIDAMGGPVTGANRYMDASGSQLTIMEEKLLANDVGYYFPRTDEGKEICDQVNTVIAEMLADGTCARITEKWLYEDMTAYIQNNTR